MSYTQSQPILSRLAGNWWALLLRVIAVVLFGLAVLFWPSLTLFVLIVFFGAYALVDGIFAVTQAVIFAQGLAMLLIGGALVALFASWPIALGQGLRAIADVAEYVQEQQSRVT